MKVYVGQTVLYALQNREYRPVMVTHIHEGQRLIDATLFNNVDKGDFANGRLLTSIPFDENSLKEGTQTDVRPNTWRFIPEEQQQEDRTRAAGSSR